jgi:hypothetical protein
VDSAAQNLEDALELADLAERMVRARLRREHPEWSDEELEQQVLAWLPCTTKDVDVLVTI